MAVGMWNNRRCSRKKRSGLGSAGSTCCIRFKWSSAPGELSTSSTSSLLRMFEHFIWMLGYILTVVQLSRVYQCGSTCLMEHVGKDFKRVLSFALLMS